jgi:hypothetical protein
MVGIVFLVTMVFGDLLQAEHVIWIAAFHFHLNGRVIDSEVMS